MTKIQIVNDNDELVGHKERSEVDFNKDIYRSSCLWIENSQAEVLLAQRSLNKDHDPGKWGPAVAGTNDQGETYESNIVKEAEEEIGLTNYEVAKVTKIHETSPNNHFIQIFYAKVDQPITYFRIQRDEVEKLEWVAREQLMNELKETSDKFVPAMKTLVDIISKSQYHA